MNKTIQIVLIGLSFVLFSCAGDKNQSFGFELNSDYDDPHIELISVSKNSPTDTQYYINYFAEDFSGIDRLVLYVDGEIASSYFVYTDSVIIWELEEFCHQIELQIKATDNLGKESYSNSLILDINYLEFEIIETEEELLEIRKSADESIWILTPTKLLKVVDNDVIELDLLEINDLSASDFLVTSNGDIYVSYSTPYHGYVYRYRNGSWQNINCPYQRWYKTFVETADGNIYVEGLGYDDHAIYQIVNEDVIFIYAPTNWYSFQHMTTGPDGSLCISVGGEIRNYVNGSWEVIFQNDFVYGFEYGPAGKLYRYSSILQTGFNIDDIYFYVSQYGIDDFSICNPDDLYLCGFYSIYRYHNNELISLKQNYFTNLPGGTFEKIESTQNGDIFVLGYKKIVILRAEELRALNENDVEMQSRTCH